MFNPKQKLIRQVVSSDGLDDRMLLSKFEHQFSEFKKMYNKAYDTEEENEHRFGVFMSNLLKARRHKKLDPTATHGVTKFFDLTPSEFHVPFLMTEKLQRPKLPNSIYNAPILSTNDLPRQVDWRNRSAVTSVKDQGHCKASWAFSAVGIMEAVHYQRSFDLVDLSAQQILDCDSNAGSHGELLVGYDANRNWTIKNSWGTNWGEEGYYRLCKGYIT
ncbi:hypothetical protein JRO89_XS02G0222700 [Xanthoceras sorbifolium]|uniref:Uncharacterized protein n=1 Tax=Xanthoceras sorbifolium TaxID=99658 RepID=A0ABQ8IH97_9ROSI|nr:hypothetical protein JRO89_XS02G0222700 [Xanthoceras sorbifolium]